MTCNSYYISNTNPDLVALTHQGPAPILCFISRWPDEPPIAVTPLASHRHANGDRVYWPVLDKATGKVFCSDGRVFETVSAYEESINV